MVRLDMPSTVKPRPPLSIGETKNKAAPQPNWSYDDIFLALFMVKKSRFIKVCFILDISVTDRIIVPLQGGEKHKQKT